jgi:heme-degrading monooxygenase HmoA
MICHVVLIRLKEGMSPEAGDRLLARAREMLAPIPGVRNLRVGHGLGKKAEVSYPYALVMEFEDEDALEAYQVHEQHRRFVRDVVDPIQDDKKVYDYRV